MSTKCFKWLINEIRSNQKESEGKTEQFQMSLLILEHNTHITKIMRLKFQ